jgi:hypothetical protein
VPLSERERRILEEIERNLYEEDPSFAGDLDRRRVRLPRRTGPFLFAAGFILLLAFFITRNILIGVAAFAAMVAGMILVAGSISAAFSGDRSTRNAAARRAFGGLADRASRRRRRP